jgi:hypothetical protein
MGKFCAYYISLLCFILSILIPLGKLDFLFELKKVSNIKFERLIWTLFCLFFALWALMSVLFDWPKLNNIGW